MPCYSPLIGFYSKNLNSTGKRSIIFNPKEALDDREIKLPCGQCIGCRLERSRQWAMRCMHESSLYEQNCFLTLTYAPEKLPEGGTLVKKHFQDFMKRLRKANPGRKIRYFHCGEYGDQNTRPHYHAIIFNYDFNDKKPLTKQKHNDLIIYTSEKLAKLWDHGISSIGAVTFDSAAYVARYVTKKITGPAAFNHYCHFDANGEILKDLLPEYTTMSRRPGIGKPWLEKYMTDVYPDDFVLMRGKKLKPPKYYDTLLNASDPFCSDSIKERREQNGKLNSQNSTPARLYVRETIHKLKAKLLKRNYEHDS